MTTPPAAPPLPDRLSDAFSTEALAAERQSLRIRFVALVLIGLVILVVTPWPYGLYYHALLPLFALTGYLNYRLRERHWPALKASRHARSSSTWSDGAGCHDRWESVMCW